MELDFSSIFTLTTMHRCLVSTLLFLLPLKRWERFPLRFLLCTAALLLLVPLIQWGEALRRGMTGRAFRAEDRLHTLLMLLPGQAIGLAVYLCLLLLVFLCCTRLRLGAAFYGALCAYLTEELVFCLTELLIQASSPSLLPLFPHYELWGTLLISVLLFAFLYFACIRRVPRGGDSLIHYSFSLSFLLFIILFGRVMITYAKAVNDHGGTSFFAISMLYNCLLLASLLHMQVLHSREQNFAVEAAIQTQLRRNQERQYRRFQSSAQAINHRLHDLKHVAAALRLEQDSARKQELLQDLERQISLYDSQIQTGSAPLDTLLSDAFLRCTQEKIQWTCIADGEALSFLDPVDLYVLLGNALDNAIESASSVSEVEKRYLSVDLRRKGELALLRVENTCAVLPRFENGAPLSTKSGPGHGFGTRSIRQICQCYHGSANMKADDGAFILSVLLPIPDENTPSHSGD